MNKNYLEIDLTESNKENDGEYLMNISLKSGNTVQFNFLRFFFRSKYLFDKYSEIVKSIENEIIKVEDEFKIKEEIIKEFIEIVQNGKAFIPIEHYKDIYALSKHFCVQKLTNLLDNIMIDLIFKDLDFSIQILLDNQEKKTEIVSKIENILKSNVNECLKNDKFKKLPISTIYRIINSAILNDREVVDINILLDFICESVENRFILFRLVELHRLRKNKIDEFIKFIDEQEEESQRIYLECIPFNFLFMKQMKHENEELFKKFIESQEELKRVKDELKQAKEELKYSHTIMVCGDDKFNQLGEKPNKNYKDYLYIHPSKKSSIDPFSLLSFSIYSSHSVQVTKSGKLLGIGDNRSGQICDSLPKTEITEFTEFSIRDGNGRQLDPISAVCNVYGTLYMFSSGSRRQLVLCDKDINGGHPVFLDIGDEYPVSLFGGRLYFAAINNKGEIIFIHIYEVRKSPTFKIKSVCLPDGEKAVSVACCEYSVVALSSNGRVFSSKVDTGNSDLNFSTVSELSGQEIVWVSGTYDHSLAVSRDGRVFGCGSNSFGKLGLGQQTTSAKSFTEISSLNNYKIRAAYAGLYHSLFETFEGKILACGSNYNSELILDNDKREYVYSPRETTITESATFCIAGGWLSAVFIGGDPPPNTPNKLIENE